MLTVLMSCMRDYYKKKTICEVKVNQLANFGRFFYFANKKITKIVVQETLK